jgi:predicted permease
VRPDWYARVRATFPHLSPDVADEVAQHLADLHEEALAGGASETEAAAVVRAALRDAAPLLDDPRSAPPAGASLWQSGQRRDERGRAGGAMFVHLGRDLTYALRTLRRQPTFAAVTIVTLAVGLGVNVAVFAVLRAALLASLSVPHPGQLVSIVTWTGAGGDHTDFSYPLYVDARDGAAPIADVAAYTAGTAGIAAADHRERVSVEFTTANYFTVLGVPMRLGLGFTGADERRGAPAVAIIGDGVWRSMFNADANVVGRTLLVNGDQATIVGVAPPSFTGFVRGRRADIWLTVSQYFPLSRSEDRMERRTTSWLSLFARLHDGIPREQLQERLTALLGSAREPGEGSDWSVHANAAAAGDASLVSDLAHPFRLLMIVVGLILVITAANVANLLLARSYSRQWEMAIRQSLGASHGRIVQQLIVEAGVLAAAGAVCALVAGTWVARLFELRTIGGGALSLSVRPDVAVVGFTAAIAIAAALVTSALLLRVLVRWRIGLRI